MWVPEWAKPASRPEASSYLNAIYEHTFAERHPTSEAVSFLRPPFDLGFLHYASDTPYSRGLNFGWRNLSYFGMDPTYAASLALARRIVQQEVERLARRDNEEALAPPGVRASTI